MYKHACQKPDCEKIYQSQDPDPYYCDECDAKRKELAKEYDKKHANKPPKQRAKTALELYDEAEKVNGLMRVKL